MEESVVKELSAKYDKEEMFIRNIIQMTINKGYDLNESKNVVEKFLKLHI